MWYAQKYLWTAAGILAIALAAPPGLGQAQIRHSGYAGGQQFWVPVELFSARSDNYAIPAGPEFVEDLLADTPLSGHAYYFPWIGDAGAEYWKVAPPEQYQADAWVQYDVLLSDLPPEFDLSGTWYFYARCQQPSEGLPSSEYNIDSDWLMVNGDPGDLNMSAPTDADWLAAVYAAVRAEDRIVNDVTSTGGVTPLWVWIGYQGTLKRPKTMTLIDGKFSFRIYEAEAHQLNARIDVICWANAESYAPTDEDFENSIGPGDCETQHTTSAVDPPSHHNDSDATLTITGTNLELVTGVRLVPAGGGSGIDGDNIVVGPGPGETTLTADFAITGAPLGVYHVLTEQPHPCFPRQLSNAFEITCPNPTIITGVSPASVTNPTGTVKLAISGPAVTSLDSVALELGGIAVIERVEGYGLAANGDDLEASFDLGCVAGGMYRIVGSRNNGCPVTRLDNGFLLRKKPPGRACAWRPVAASWFHLNLGEDLDPPNGVFYNPTNWDYSFSQKTVLNTPQDTPPGGGNYALHWFLDAQPPEVVSDGEGSGGVYQEITVTPGVPLEYSYWWKGAHTTSRAWFEFLLIDGPFSLWFADAYQEQTEGACNPSIIRKKEFFEAAGSFAWEQVTDEDPPVVDPCGERPTTMTPTGDVVTVMLKAGRIPRGAMESFFDNVEVWQGEGPNLVVNGDFEVTDQTWPCDNQAMFQDECERDFWLWGDFVILPPCHDPFADADEDNDVDQDDFSVFQLCYTGSRPWNPEILEGCECYDRPEPIGGDGDVDEIDYVAFEACASGPGVPADPACDN